MFKGVNSLITNFEYSNIYKNILNGNLIVNKNYFNHDYYTIFYNPVDIKDLGKIIEIKKHDNIFIELKTENHIYYVSQWISEKIDIKNYIYFHSNLLLKLTEVNNTNLQKFKDHSTICELYNKENYLKINDDS